MTAGKKRVTQAPSPGSFLTGWARQGVQGFVAAQKILLDLAARETALTVYWTNNGLRLPVAAGTMAELLRHRVETLIELQKGLLDATAEQVQAATESYDKGEKVHVGARVVELARRGVERFVESEKKFLDLASHEVSAATKGDKRADKPPRERMEVLTRVVREGGKEYIEAEKKLLELAIEQLEATVKAGRRYKEAARKEVRPLLGELTEKSMKNFVTAENSLLDLAMKPMEEPRREVRRKVSQRRQTAHRAAKKIAGRKVRR